MEISWFGDFNSVHAFSTINRQLSKAMEKRGHKIFRNDHYNNKGQITPVHLIFQYEYKFNSDVQHPFHVGFMTWEFGGEESVPRGWKAGTENWNLTLAISDWVGRVFYRNGISPLSVVHMGVDPEEFKYQEHNHTPYTFLWAGGSDKRHSWDIAIQAFEKAFPKDKDVRLILKLDTSYPSILEYVKNINDPRIHYMQCDIKSMAEFYHSGDCMLFPVRGAGPGLIGMEAMACGLPVIITNGGGCKEYSKYAYKVDGSINETVHHCKTDSPHPFWIEPNIDTVIKQMQYVESHKEEAAELGKQASEYIRSEWTWDKSGEQLEYLLEKLIVKPKVSLVILVHNRPEMLKRCFNGIVKHTNDVGFELVIVDNFSNDWEPPVDVALKHPHNKVVRLNENRGVSGGRNVGLKNATADYIMFLDDDAVPTQDEWLSRLLHFLDNPEVGIVGQTGTYIPDNQWGIFWESKGVTECDVVQGYCQLFPRSTYEKVGPIDESYGKFWHEDADWCLAIRKAGYKVIDADNVGIFHVGSGSGDDGTYMKKLERLQSKWGNVPNLRVPKERWHTPWKG